MKQTMLHLPHGLLLRHKKEPAWMNLKSVVLSEEKPVSKATYPMAPRVDQIIEMQSEEGEHQA